jgi:hypothetical protein
MTMPSITLSKLQIARLAAFCAKHNQEKWFLAKDEGAYVGACSQTAKKSDGKPENCIFYFPGCDPVKNADWYDTARHQFGGDDFGEHFDASALADMVKQGVDQLRINVGATEIRMTTIGGTP